VLSDSKQWLNIVKGRTMYALLLILLCGLAGSPVMVRAITDRPYSLCVKVAGG
jgi:hypothetical protein